MDEKERLLKRLTEVKDDKRIIQEWMVIENNRMREEDILMTATEEALEKGIEKGTTIGKEANQIEIIKNMLNKGYDYHSISEITQKSIEEIKNIEDNL